MPIGGKLVLKGGVTLAGGVDKKKKKKAKSVTAGEGAEPTNDAGNEADGAAPGQPGASGAVGTGSKPPSAVPATAVNVMSGKAYEQEFEFETKRMEEGKVRSNPWGSSYRAAPAILHGYSKPVTGKTAEERLDMRAARKSDKYCK